MFYRSKRPELQPTAGRSRFLISCLLIAGALLSGCTKNILSDFAAKSSDAYQLDSAKKALDEEDFDNAIISGRAVLVNEPGNQDAVFVVASAYAGRAGLRTLDLFLKLANEISSKTIFAIFAESFPAATDDAVNDIESAISVLESIGARGADRTPEMNFFAMFVYYSRIGIILNRFAYDATNVVRTNFTACQLSEDVSGAKTGLPDVQVDKIMTALARISDTSGHISGGGSGFSALRTNIGLSGLPFDPLPCSTATGAGAISCLLVRTLVNVGSPTGIGLGTANDITIFPESPLGVCAFTLP